MDRTREQYRRPGARRGRGREQQGVLQENERSSLACARPVSCPQSATSWATSHPAPCTHTLHPRAPTLPPVQECVADLRQRLQGLGSDLVVAVGQPEQLLPGEGAWEAGGGGGGGRGRRVRGARCRGAGVPGCEGLNRAEGSRGCAWLAQLVWLLARQ